jgi:hypothetical protein
VGHRFYLTDITGSKTLPDETSDGEFGGMTGRDHSSNRCNRRVMG